MHPSVSLPVSGLHRGEPSVPAMHKAPSTQGSSNFQVFNNAVGIAVPRGRVTKKVRERRHRLAPHARDGLAGATYAEAERERSWMRDDPWRRSPHTGFVGTPSRVDPPPERSTQ